MKNTLVTTGVLGVIVGGAVLFGGTGPQIVPVVTPQEIVETPIASPQSTLGNEVVDILVTVYSSQGEILAQNHVGDIGGTATSYTDTTFDSLPQGKSRELEIKVEAKEDLNSTLSAIFTDDRGRVSTTTISAKTYSRNTDSTVPRLPIPDSIIALRVMATKDSWPTKTP